MKKRSVAMLVVVAGLASGLVSCAGSGEKGRTAGEVEQPGASQPIAKVTPPAVGEAKPRDYPGIHNAVAFHEGFISGAVPEGEAGFATLTGMGVKTIISVDGAEPEVEKAKAAGIRYIHLPIGYNGFDEQRKLELVRATRDAMKDGPVYIHCHHGKHRSAGAAATVAASLGWITPDEGVERMKVSGTAPNYKGLYACASNAAPVAPSVVNAVPAFFPEVAKPQGFVKGMVDIDEAMEHLKAIEKAGWKTPADHPDLVPAAEAGRVADLLRQLGEGPRAKSSAAGFGDHLRANSKLAQTLEDLLVVGEKDASKLSAQFKSVAASCKDCHTIYRD